MRHTISSPELTVNCSPAGAELTSIRDRDGGEYLWQAGPAWRRHAPVLFPIVGRLKNDRYTYRGREYSMTQHGFARDRVFSVTEEKKDRLGFELRADEESRKIYPFDFGLKITYSLQGPELTTFYQVTNHGKEPMLFSIGAHPGFCCPFLPDENFSDHFLLLERYSVMQTVLHGGLRGKETRLVPLDGKRLQLSPALFDQDALVFENGQVNEISLRSPVSGRGVRMRCEGWPYFGIWSKKGAEEFVCLEPWYGIADSADASGRLEEKEGIMTLEAGHTFDCSFVTAFF